MSQATQHKLGRDSFVNIERSTWSITYPTLKPPFLYTVNYTENGLLLHLAKSDMDMGQQNIERVLKLFGTSVGGVMGAIGTIALPGGGTIAGITAGAALGSTMSELASIVVSIAKYLAVDGQGNMDLHMSPHGFQCGSNFAGDPNIFLGPLWRPIYGTLQKLQPQKGSGTIKTSSVTPSMDPAKVDPHKPMTGSRAAAAG
jgi:hypothetical protein